MTSPVTYDPATKTRPLTDWLSAEHYCAPASRIVRVTHSRPFDFSRFLDDRPCKCSAPEHAGHEYEASCKACSYHVIGPTMRLVLARVERDDGITG